jgi:hypothetical protein
MSLCSCDVSLQNTGRPNCYPIIGVQKQFILVPLVANDGTENSVNPLVTLSSNFFTQLVNEADDSKRWYPTGELKNVAGERAEPVYETFEDQSKILIRQGVRNVTALIIKGSPELSGQLNANQCSTFGIFIIDNNGNLIGKVKNNDGLLYPIAIDAATFNSKFVFTNDSAVQKLMLSFEWAIDERDEDMKMILASDITGINLVNLKGLMNVYAEVLSCDQTEMVVNLKIKQGDIIHETPVRGLTISDFISSDSLLASRIYNITDASDVTLVSVVESTTVAGQYTLTYPSQVVADVLQPLLKKNSLDASTMLGTTGVVV